ncbi:MAG: hypothetical protein AB7F39_06660 [Variibacter sp.]
MKYASECLGRSTSVHEWKPIAFDRFSKAIHHLATTCSDDDGTDGVHPFAMKLDRASTATIWYMPKKGKAPDAISTPVLLTVQGADGRLICFESLSHAIPGLQ